MDESGRSRAIRHPRIHRPDAGGRLSLYVHVPGPLENDERRDEGAARAVVAGDEADGQPPAGGLKVEIKAQRADRAARALSVAKPVLAYICR